MTCIRSFSIVAAAAETLSKGVNISSFTKQDFTNLYRNDTSIFNILVDDETKNMFNLPSIYAYRSNNVVYALKEPKDDFVPNLTLTFDKVKEIMKVLWELNIESFTDFEEKDYIDRYEELVKELDKNFDCSLPMHEELTREKTDEALKIFLALFAYKNNYSKILYDDSKLDKEFHLTKAKDYDIIDNRLYLYIKPSMLKKIEKIYGSALPDNFKKIKAFVVSKNIYDYFWASYGNTFQSCFSLSSSYGYLYGYVPFAKAPESFICYATTGGVNKIPVISGKQFRCPNMLFRCWGYASDKGDLILDKRYTSEDTRCINAVIETIRPCLNIIDDYGKQCVERKLYQNGKNIFNIFNDTEGYFYSDSLRLDETKNSVSFAYGFASRVVGVLKSPWLSTHKNFMDYASTITSVSPTLSLDKPCKVVSRMLLNPKVCPVTGLYISDSETQSPFAKFYLCNCKTSAIITHIGGQVFLDEMSDIRSVETSKFFIVANPVDGFRRGFYNGVFRVAPYSSLCEPTSKCVTLESLKETLKGDINNFSLDGVLLRYFEGHEVKYQFYKHKR